MSKLLAILALLLVFGLTSAALADAPSDPNTWATASVVGPAQGSPAGNYDMCWTVNPTADWPAGWLLVGVEFQPDGSLDAYTSNAQPTGWTLYNPTNTWLAWYASPDSQQDQTLVNGLDSAAAASAQWCSNFTTTGAINDYNYHLVFVSLKDNGRYEIVQSSLTASPVPEPATITLLGGGLLGLVGFVRRRKK